MVTGRHPSARAGHSLPELIVAVTFLATTVVAVGGTAVLGARWTSDAVLRQEAVRAAGAVLDSIVTAGAAGSGERTADGLAIRWVREGDRLIVVVSKPGHEGPLVRLSGRTLPPVEVFPDSAHPAPGPSPASSQR